ncbi:hypothetical protein [Aliikangiella maris]|uniref:hypothetical protein n=1 Tax=Aliikangiella maris TaxID=3162458 RepID=UPI00339396DD
MIIKLTKSFIKNTIPHYKQLLYKKFNHFEIAKNKQKSLLEYEIKSLIEDLHILGLVYYKTSKNNHELEKVHGCFLDALEQDSNYYIVRLYSAHCFHDKKEYSKALTDYLKVDSVNMYYQSSILLKF